ncbi:MAG: hypothetical protein IH946_10405, partial [Bacteroidetes bacterium]|nr:hypothetical protein [Bacteroidota bacterium]
MKTLILIPLILIFIPAFTQNSNRLYTLNQYSGTNDSLVDYFKRNGLSSNSGYIYAFMFRPMGCPRCEGIIDPLTQMIKQADSNSTVIIMAFYPKIDAGLKYLERRAFTVDKILLNEKTHLLELFDISSSGLDVPFLLKFDQRTGTLVYSEAILGMSINDEHVNNIVCAITPLTTTNRKQISQQRSTNSIRTLNMLRPVRPIELKGSPQHPVSRISLPYFDENTKRLSFSDDLSLNIYINDMETGEQLYALTPSEKEQRMFIDSNVNDTLYQFLLMSNILNSMYFSSAIVNEQLMITASLPKVSFDGEIVGYHNQPCLVFRPIANLEEPNIQVLDTLPVKNLVLIHTKTKYFKEQQLLVLPIHKGWPTVGTSIEDTIGEKNPFKRSFYDQAPLFALYTVGGDFISFAGNIDLYSIKHQAGYAFCKPLISINAKQLWITSGFSGTIYKYDLTHPQTAIDSIMIFKPTTPEDKLPERLKMPFQYMKSLNLVFNKKLTDMHIEGDTLSLIMHDKSRGYSL